MTARRFILTSLSLLATCLCLGGCVSARSPGKAAQPDSSGDIAQSELPENRANGPIDGAPQEPMQFSQPPLAEVSGGERKGRETPPPASRAESQQAASAAGMADRSPASVTSEATKRNGAVDLARQHPSEAIAKGAPKRAPERPGLATLWGETRESHVTTTSFVRGGAEPWSVMRIQYDDQAGILSRTGLNNTLSFGANLIQTPDGMVTVQVINGEGDPLAGVNEGSRAFVIGHQGERYGIRVTNHSSERFELVATVDGLDVLDGKPGSFTKRGYLLDAFSNVEIDGFRRSTTEVAAFRFGAVSDSYAAKTSGARNVGVIGVAVFREYRPVDRARLEENRRRDDADPFPRRFAAPPPVAPMIRD